jgi:hypothetical protein
MNTLSEQVLSVGFLVMSTFIMMQSQREIVPLKADKAIADIQRSLNGKSVLQNIANIDSYLTEKHIPFQRTKNGITLLLPAEQIIGEEGTTLLPEALPLLAEIAKIIPAAKKTEIRYLCSSGEQDSAFLLIQRLEDALLHLNPNIDQSKSKKMTSAILEKKDGNAQIEFFIEV